MGKLNAAMLLEGFVAAEDEAALWNQLDRVTHDLGFTQFAMGHHVDLVRPPADAIRLTNYHPEWIERSLGERYYVDDPIHRASTRTAKAFLWSEAGAFIRVTPRQSMILDLAQHYGLCEGFTVPVQVAGEYRGTCSFAARSLDSLVPRALLIAQLSGIYAFDAARKIMRKRSNLSRYLDRVPILTDRQRDSLVLVARGKADPEIGTLLGISRATAHEHVEAVRHAYGHAQRTFLVARALFDGQISFAEIFNR